MRTRRRARRRSLQQHILRLRLSTALKALPAEEQQALAALQEQRLTVNLDDADPDVAEDAYGLEDAAAGPPKAASFADSVYEKPSAYIRDLVAGLPEDQKLTRDQTLFVVAFAKACDEAWDDDVTQKPWGERKVAHFLLLGQGGSGKTHVVQKIVFKAVAYIWPPPARDRSTLMCVAFSNAQAKNISTAEWRARTLHNTAVMRVPGHD